MDLTPPLLCKDCGAIANPEHTMRAADYGCEGPDLHFCDACKARGDALWAIVEKGLAEGKITVERLAEEIGKERPN